MADVGDLGGRKASTGQRGRRIYALRVDRDRGHDSRALPDRVLQGCSTFRSWSTVPCRKTGTSIERPTHFPWKEPCERGPLARGAMWASGPRSREGLTPCLVRCASAARPQVGN